MRKILCGCASVPIDWYEYEVDVAICGICGRPFMRSIGCPEDLWLGEPVGFHGVD